MEDQLLKKIRSFFSDENWPTASFFVCRQDGVLLHAQRSKAHAMSSSDEQSVGVLMGGVWQAACALMNLLPQKSRDDFFRLSFDTTDKGVYLLPVTIGGRDFYLGTVFANETNPGQMKAKVRNLVVRLEESCSNSLVVPPPMPRASGQGRSDKNSELLFKDLSDDEVDRLFSAAGI